MAKIHRFLPKNSTPFAPNVIIFAVRFKSAPNTGAIYFPKSASALANLPVTLSPFFTTVLKPMTIVVIIPPIDIATTDISPKFFLAHCLNLVKSLFCASSSTVLCAISLSGRWFITLILFHLPLRLQHWIWFHKVVFVQGH